MLEIAGRPDPFAHRLQKSNQTLFGTWVKIPALEVVELLAIAGFDYIVLDMEHAPLTLEAVYRATVVAQGLGLGVLVRVADRSGGLVQRLLDSGVDGLLIPHVGDQETARSAAQAMTFEPQGRRGMGITSRAGRWGLESMSAYLEKGRDQIIRCPQLEDRDALEDAEAIALTPGLNALFIGLGDLSLSTGLAPNDPEIQRLVQHVLSVCKKHDLPCGTAVASAAAARSCRDQGFRFVMINNDAGMLGQTAREINQALHN